MPYADRRALVVAESPHFKVFLEATPVIGLPSRQDFEQTYFLMIPKEHLPAFSYVQAAYQREVQELLQYLSNITNCRSAVMFEHGEAGLAAFQAKSVAHAHLHVITTNDFWLDKISAEISSYGISYRLINGNSTVNQAARAQFGHDYWFISQNGRFLMIRREDIPDKLPSQFMKRVLATVMQPHLPYADWKNPQPETDKIVYQRLRTAPTNAILR